MLKGADFVPWSIHYECENELRPPVSKSTMTRFKFAADFEVRQDAYTRRRPRRVLSSAERGAMLRNNVCAKAERWFVPYACGER